MTDTIAPASGSPDGPAAGDPAAGRPQGPRLPLIPTPGETAARAWRRLRRMSTALVLLFSMAVATLIATFIPQEPVIAPTVRAWRAGTEGPGAEVARVMDALGLFDVFGSVWFAAITLLLFASLTGCLLPRYRIFWRNVRRPPARATRLERLSTRVEIPLQDPDPDAVLDRAQRVFSTYRTRRTTGAGDAPQLAIERGHWREAGSLVFHTSFYLLLIGVILGSAFSFTGQIDIVEGGAWADTPIGYDSVAQGRFWDTSDHGGHLATLDDFAVTYLPDGFTPDEFVSTVTFTPPDGSTPQTREIRVNHPAHFGGLTYYQRGFGFAPRLEIADGLGERTLYAEELVLRTDDSGLWVGRGKVSVGTRDPVAPLPQIGVEVVFLPDAEFDDQGRVVIRSPQPNNPRLLLSLYLSDDLGLDQPLPLSRLEWPQDAIVDQVMLTPGDTAVLAGGLLQATFADLALWSGLQVSHQPFRWLLLTAASLTLMGLLPSLYAYRRRLWVEVREDHVVLAGVAQHRPAVFDDRFPDIAQRLAQALGSQPRTPREYG